MGGNDARFADIVKSCISPLYPAFCQDVALSEESEPAGVTVPRAIDGPVKDSLEEMLRAIHSRAPNARIVLMGYPPLFENGGQCVVGVTSGEANFLNSEGAHMSSMTAALTGALSNAATNPIPVTFADPPATLLAKASAGTRKRSTTLSSTQPTETSPKPWVFSRRRPSRSTRRSPELPTTPVPSIPLCGPRACEKGREQLTTRRRGWPTRLLLLAVWVTGVASSSGCAPTVSDLFAPEVRSARAAGEAEVRQILDSVDTEGGEHGRARADGCSAGQDNFTAVDPFEFFCGKGEAVVLGLGRASGPERAAQLGDKALSGTCPGAERGRLVDDKEGLDGSRTGGEPVPRTSYLCGQVGVEARVQKTTDGPAALELSRLPYAAAQRSVEAGKLDGPASVQRAAEAGNDYVLVLFVTKNYYEKPRG